MLDEFSKSDAPDRRDPRVVQGEMSPRTAGLDARRGGREWASTPGMSSRRLCDCLMGLPALAGLRKERPGRRRRRHPGGRLRHRPEPGPLPRARPQDHHGRSQPRHEQVGGEADRRQRHRGRSADARRRDDAVRRGDLRLRGEHLDDVQHPGRREGTGRGLPGPEAGRSARLPGARAERGPRGPGVADGGSTRSSGSWPMGAAWTWTSRPPSGASPSAGSKSERFVMEELPRTHGTMYRGSAVK